MDIKVRKTIGTAQLEVTFDDKEEKEALAKATVFMQPDYCGLCKGTNIVWEANKATTDDGTFTYIKRKCINKECFATSTLGEFKTGGYFWKQWEIYQKDGGFAAPTPKVDGELNPEQIPF